MRAIRRSREEQYQLVLECRQSGLSDYNWCRENGINPGTFYNWVKRLRKYGGYDIPDPAGKDTYAALPKQDVVKIELMEEKPIQIYQDQDTSPCYQATVPFQHSLELHIGTMKVMVSNDVDPNILALALQTVKSQTIC